MSQLILLLKINKTTRTGKEQSWTSAILPKVIFKLNALRTRKKLRNVLLTFVKVSENMISRAFL